MNKVQSRIRRGKKAKAIQRHSTRPRLVVNRSSVHIYSQIIVRAENGDKTIVSCSTLDKELREKLEGTKVEQAKQVGKLLAKRAAEHQIKDVAFDRSGNKFHGRVKALADSAREAGLNF